MMNPLYKSVALLGITVIAVSSFAQGGSRGQRNPFAAPDATVHYAPDRQYDLLDMKLDFDVDYPNRTVHAMATNTLAALSDDTGELRFHTGDGLSVQTVEVNGRATQFTKDAEGILVHATPLRTGEKAVVTIHYTIKKGDAKNPRGTGWHWHEPKKNEPAKLGFWTNGETDQTRDWAPTWDYPNDFTTTETRTTVPSEWMVVGNGSLISNTVSPDGKRRTVVWRMTQPHATYLTSVVGGPFDIKQDVWRGVPLWYVVPKGKGHYIEYTFAHTKDMLSFYSDNLGVKYPWPKYAQDCTFDFGGGQENVSATTLGQEFLTDPRDDRYAMDSLNSHEMGHQWFGDYVTCKDWGQIWLNESFATLMEMTYTLHSEGINSSQREVEDNSQGYFAEAKRYRRPLATNFYSNPGVMFDQHTYPKGGALLFTLRKKIGEKAFYAGLNRYLTLHHNQPVETNDLCEAMTDASGINLHPWFDQWILKPGHPVIDWSWSWDEAKKQAVVHVKQTQDRSIGTPVYDVPTHVALISHRVELKPVHLNSEDQEFRIDAAVKPDAVVFDPDHEFVREIPKQPWSADEAIAVLQYAPDCVDRARAMSQVLTGNPSDSAVQAVVAVLRKDQGPFPALLGTGALIPLKRADLRPFFESELRHENYQRRMQAVNALERLPSQPAENENLRKLINDQQPYRVVAAAITALSNLDFAGSQAVITGQAKSSNGRIRGAALGALAQHDAPGVADLVFQDFDEAQPDNIRAGALTAMTQLKHKDPRMVTAVRSVLSDGGFNMVFAAVGVAQAQKLTEVIPDLEAYKKRVPFFADRLDEAIKAIKS
jgi:aminopeptidase N